MSDVVFFYSKWLGFCPTVFQPSTCGRWGWNGKGEGSDVREAPPDRKQKQGALQLLGKEEIR